MGYIENIKKLQCSATKYESNISGQASLKKTNNAPERG